MPFPRPHLRVTWFGDAWAQQEEWSTGLRLDGTTLPTPSQLEALDTAFAILFSGPGVAPANGVRYLGVKVAPQDVNGKYGAEGQAVEYIRPAPLTANFGTGLPQATMVATLTTATPRGLANEGRMYLPATVHRAAPDGRVVEGVATDLLSAMQNFLPAVDAVGIGQVTVFSATRAGAARDVTGVRIGRVVDTQRRRRNRIAELYVSGSLGN